MCRDKEAAFLPHHPVHDQDVAQESHHADDWVESRDGDGDDEPARAPHGTGRLRLVAGAQPGALLVCEGDVEGDDRVEVGQRELRPRHCERLHVSAAAVPLGA